MNPFTGMTIQQKWTRKVSTSLNTPVMGKNIGENCLFRMEVVPTNPMQIPWIYRK